MAYVFVRKPHEPFLQLSLEQRALRLARLQYHMRSRIRESLAGCLAGRIPLPETEDFLVWPTEAYRQQRA